MPIGHGELLARLFLIISMKNTRKKFGNGRLINYLPIGPQTRIGSFKLIDFILALFFPGQYKKVYSKSDPDTSWFYYSDDIGIGYFPQRMSEEIVKLGGSVITEANVTSIEKEKNNYIISYTKEGVLYKEKKFNHRILPSFRYFMSACLVPKVPDTNCKKQFKDWNT